MKHTIHGHLYWHMTKYMKAPAFVFEKYDRREWSEDSRDGHVWIREHSIEVDVPDNFDPRPSMVEALRKEKERIRAEFAAKVTELDKQINNLLALEA